MISGDFFGRPTAFLQNDLIRVEYLTYAGPRIVRVFLDGDLENQLAEMNHKQIETSEGTFNMMGGHRLWHAPESSPRTYIPDEDGVSLIQREQEVVLLGPVEAKTGIQKQIRLELKEGLRGLILHHRLTNFGFWMVELAPWAITQFPLGGEARFSVDAPVTSPYLPNRQITFWSYTRTNDPRLKINDQDVVISAEAGSPPFKIGSMNHQGWVSYTRRGWRFEKRFQPQVDRIHPDMNCNTEIYVWDDFIELETLGPIARLAPGESVEHEEVWEWSRTKQS